MRTALLFVMAALPAAAAAQWTIDAEVSRVYDDNLSRAQRASDMIGDRALVARGALGRVFDAGEGTLTARLEARAARYDNHGGLDYAALGLGAGWRRKLGLGLTAPWIALDASISHEDFSERVRDGRRGALSLTLGRRFSERVDGLLGAAYDRRSQRDAFPTVPLLSGRPFSLQGRSVFAKGSLAFGERALVSAGAALRKGDVVSSTRRNFAIFSASDALSPDAAFGADFFAYQLTGARTASYSVAVSWALGPRASIDAGIVTDRTRTHGGLDYDGNVYSIGLVYRD